MKWIEKCAHRGMACQRVGSATRCHLDKTNMDKTSMHRWGIHRDGDSTVNSLMYATPGSHDFSHSSFVVTSSPCHCLENHSWTVFLLIHLLNGTFFLTWVNCRFCLIASLFWINFNRSAKFLKIEILLGNLWWTRKSWRITKIWVQESCETVLLQIYYCKISL